MAQPGASGISTMTALALGTEVKAPPPYTPQLCVLIGGAPSQRSLWPINGLTGSQRRSPEFTTTISCIYVALIISSSVFRFRIMEQKIKIKQGIKC